MGKGLLSGVAWGALASVLVLGGVSVFAPLPEEDMAAAVPDGSGGLEAPETDAAPEAPEAAPAGAAEAEVESELSPPPGSEFARAGEDSQPEAPGADAGPVAPATPARPGVEVAEAPQPDTAPPAVPETVTEGVAPPAAAPVVEDSPPVIGGADGDLAGAGAEAPEPAAAPDVAEAPEVADAPEADVPAEASEAPSEPESDAAEAEVAEAEAVEAAIEEAVAEATVPRSTPEAVGAEDVAAPASDSEAVGAAQGEAAAAPVASAEVARSESAERTRPVRAEAAGETAPVAAAVAPATSGEVVTVAGSEPAVRAGEAQVAEATEAEVVTGTEPAPAAETARAETVAPAPAEDVAGSDPEVAPVTEEAAEEAATVPEVVEIVEVEPETASQPEAVAEAPVAEAPAVPVAPEQAEGAPAADAPGREAPTQTAEAPAVPEAERPGARSETDLPAQPSAPPATVPITEREPRTGDGLPRRIVTNGAGDGNGGGFGKRVVPLTERNKPGRLPVVGASAETEAEAAEAPRLSALAANAAPFENPEAKPLVSVILYDVGDQGLDRAALKAINFPVTFAVDPTDPGAAETARGYRDAGFEVLILPSGLPQGATPQDMETTLQSHFRRFPGAMGLLTTGDEGVTGSPALTRQLLAIAGDTGHGLVFFDSGLNSAQRGAESAGLPSTLVWKQLDAAGEAGDAIGRTLDRAAFRAGQEGTVVVMGHSLSQTVTSLLDWAAGSKGQSVALAPVSAVLMR